ITSDQLGRRLLPPHAQVFNVGIGNLRTHVCPEIRESSADSCSQYREQARSIQAEEVDARLIWVLSGSHVSSYVEFGKCACCWNQGKPTETHVAHPERDHSHPSLTFKCV